MKIRTKDKIVIKTFTIDTMNLRNLLVLIAFTLLLYFFGQQVTDPGDEDVQKALIIFSYIGLVSVVCVFIRMLFIQINNWYFSNILMKLIKENLTFDNAYIAADYVRKDINELDKYIDYLERLEKYYENQCYRLSKEITARDKQENTERYQTFSDLRTTLEGIKTVIGLI